VTILLTDALAISVAWSNALDLRGLIERQVRDSGLFGRDVDVVAVGKAAREMALALHVVLGSYVQRQLIIVDEGPAFSLDTDVEFVIGEHPFPGLGSLLAGERLVEFLERSGDADGTIFLISGGASSLCALPQPPVELHDLHELFKSVLESGADITTLNQLRASCSSIAGGAILRSVRTPRSLSLIMVDNVVSGARWVASGLTFDFVATLSDVAALLQVVGASNRLSTKIMDACERRNEVMSAPVTTIHANRVIAEPSHVLLAVTEEAARRGFRVIDVGGALHGDVQDVVALMEGHISSGDPERLCVVGIGEVTLRIQGDGVGGRCQDLAWRMAEVLDGKTRNAVTVARATDGRDFVKGIAGGWVDETTMRRARERGIDWSSVVANSDSYTALNEMGQLITGGRTGWNLCDVYITVVDAAV
jgi:glycerate 2-kinase